MLGKFFFEPPFQDTWTSFPALRGTQSCYWHLKQFLSCEQRLLGLATYAEAEYCEMLQSHRVLALARQNYHVFSLNLVMIRAKHAIHLLISSR